VAKSLRIRRFACVAVVAVAVAALAAMHPQATVHAAPFVCNNPQWIDVSGISSTTTHSYANGSSVTLHAQLQIDEDPQTGCFAGYFRTEETITGTSGRNGYESGSTYTILVYKSGSSYLTFNSPTPALGVVPQASATTLDGTAKFTTCAAAGAKFTPGNGDAAFTTGTANYCH